MKRQIRLTEQDLHRIVKESVNRILNEEFGVDFEDTLKWVQKKNPNMSPQEQERFANNILNKRGRETQETDVQSGTYTRLKPKDADEWWVLHIYYGFEGRNEKHYTVFSEKEAKKIIAKWDKWESEKRPRFPYQCEAFHVENPNHSNDEEDWYYEHWSPNY